MAAGIGLVALSSLLFGLAFPTARVAPLAWLALAPLFVALRRGRLGGALLLTWLWCVTGACLVGDWFPRAVADYFHQPMPVAIALFVGVFTLMAAPYLCAFTAAYRALARGPVRRLPLLPLLAGAAWTGAELARGRLFTGTPFFIGNPWGLLGYSQADVLPLVQIASVTGVYGVSFALACANAGLAELWLARREPARRRAALVGLGLALAPGAVVALHGAFALRAAGPEPGSEPVRVAIAQGNVDVGAHWRSDAYGENLDLYLRLTDAAARRARPEIAFWPESAMTFFLEREPLYRGALAVLLRAHDLELVAGGPRMLGDDEAAGFTNSVYVVAPDGALADRYDKQYLVPFAEYFPIGIDVLRRSFGRIRSFAHGVQVAPVATRAGRAGVLVCNESMLPEVARERVLAGAVYLVNPSNDSWIPDAKYTEQQLDIARLRAVEQRRWLVRASTAGPSALVDPWGRVAARTPGLERAVAAGEIWPRRGLSLYARLGDAFGFACLGAAALGVISARRHRPGDAASP
jgi:apolipoprotein N-acyltransferase